MYTLICLFQTIGLNKDLLRSFISAVEIGWIMLMVGNFKKIWKYKRLKTRECSDHFLPQDRQLKALQRTKNNSYFCIFNKTIKRLFSIFLTVADNELGRIQLCKYRSEQFCKTRLEESGWNESTKAIKK